MLTARYGLGLKYNNFVNLVTFRKKERPPLIEVLTSGEDNRILKVKITPFLKIIFVLRPYRIKFDF